MKNLLLSVAIGDIAGSTYEFRSEKDYSKILLPAPKSFFTDDTVCTFACAEALLDNLDMAQNLQTRCRQHPHSGYGGSFFRWLRSSNPQPYGSYGNGSAMRCSAAGWLAKSEQECVALATATAEPTHNHPEGIKGAVATALAIYHLRTGKDKDFVRHNVLEYYYPDWSNRSYAQFHDTYSFNVTCQGSVPAAIICFLESKDFSDFLRLAIALGGDADTLAAIGAPMAYAYYKTMPDDLVTYALSVLPQWMLDINDRLTID